MVTVHPSYYVRFDHETEWTEVLPWGFADASGVASYYATEHADPNRCQEFAVVVKAGEDGVEFTYHGEIVWEPRWSPLRGRIERSQARRV